MVKDFKSSLPLCTKVNFASRAELLAPCLHVGLKCKAWAFYSTSRKSDLKQEKKPLYTHIEVQDGGSHTFLLMVAGTQWFFDCPISAQFQQNGPRKAQKAESIFTVVKTLKKAV